MVQGQDKTKWIHRRKKRMEFIKDAELLELMQLNEMEELEIIADYKGYCLLIDQELNRESWLEYYEENIAFGGIN